MESKFKNMFKNIIILLKHMALKTHDLINFNFLYFCYYFKNFKILFFKAA